MLFFKKLRSEQNLHGKKLVQYLWDYYKLPFAVLCVLLYLALYPVYRHFTDRTPVLYAALINVNAGETLTGQLSGGFLEASGADTSRSSLPLYSGLYLTDDQSSAYYEYTYASQLKLLAAIDGEQLDVVLMNREAFDAFSQNGYLCNIDELLAGADAAFYRAVKPWITENIYIAEDNAATENSSGASSEIEAYPMGLDLSHAALFRHAGFEEPVYCGVLANSPRKDAAAAYLQYLFYGSSASL